MSEIPSDRIVDSMETMLNIASDSTRLKILYALSDTERNVKEIGLLIGASQSLVSHQLNVLKKAKLIALRKDGRHSYYSLADDHVMELLKVVHEHVTE